MDNPISRLLTSGLESVVKKEGVPTVEAPAVLNSLEKQGVNAEELNFSGVADSLQAAKGQVTSSDMANFVERRPDQFNIVDPGTQRNATIRPRDAKLNPTYRENVYTFSVGDEGSHFTSTDYPGVQNYLAHTTGQREQWDGVPTKVIFDIKSDLHELGNATGYADKTAKFNFDNKSLDELEHELNLMGGDFTDYTIRKVYSNTFGKSFDELAPAEKQKVRDTFSNVYEIMSNSKPGTDVSKAVQKELANLGAPPESPYKDRYFLKLLEHEVANAVEAGDAQIALPLRGEGLDTLMRSESAQLHADTQGAALLKSVAKKQGWAYSEVVKTNADAAKYNALADAVEIAAGTQNTKRILDLAADPAFSTDVSVQNLVKSIQQFKYIDSATAKDAAEALRKQGAPSTYGVLKLNTPGAKPFNAKLYTPASASIFATYAALQSGMTPEGLKAKLLEQGESEESANDILSKASKIDQAKAAGYTDEAIRAHFDEAEATLTGAKAENPLPVDKNNYYDKEPDKLPDIRSSSEQAAARVGAQLRKEQAYRARQAILGKNTLPSNELFANLRVLNADTTFLFTRVSGWLGNEEASRIAEQNATAAREKVLATAKAEFGVDATYDTEAQVYIDKNTGQQYTLGMWDDLWQDMKGSRAELGYGALMGVGGAVAGSARFGPVGGFIGSLAGAALGSMMGSNVDYMRAAFKLSQEMDAEMMVRRSLSAAELSLVGDTAAGALFKIAKMGVRGGRSLGQSGVQTVQRLLNYVKGGDLESAFKSLKANLALTDDEANEIVTQLSRLSTVPGDTEAEQKILAATLTRPGGERLVKAAIKSRPRAGQALIRDIDSRAQALTREVEALQDPNAAKNVLADLEGYRMDVKQAYSDVITAAASSTKSNQYRFDFDKLALEPVLNSLKKELVDPTARQRFLLQMQKIKQYAKTNSFSDLLELRQIVNGLTYSKSIKNAKDFKALKGVIDTIDAEIERGSDLAIDNPIAWRADYAEAKRVYSEMKVLENNQLYKIINRPGMTAEGIAKALTRYAPSLDDTYQVVISKLPRQTRDAVEGEVVRVLADKYTAGAEGGLRAIQFPQLSEELNRVPLTTPDARKLRMVVNELGEVFKNDLELAKTGGQLQGAAFTSYLTTDPIVRAKFELASQIFNRVKQLVPGERQQDLALVQVLSKLLDKPLNATLVKDLVTKSQGRIDISEQLKALTQSAARASADQADATAGRVKLYGEPNSKVLSFKGSNHVESIPAHRIATMEEAEQLAKAAGINPADRKALDEELINNGYKAVQFGTEKVRRLTK